LPRLSVADLGGDVQGDLVGIFSENRVEWVVTEQACNAYSLVCVPVYDAGDGCLQYILNHARLTVVIASRPKTFKARCRTRTRTRSTAHARLTSGVRACSCWTCRRHARTCE
jgi:long-subunit acyl-CoA synthetase (AMP-forming)